MDKTAKKTLNKKLALPFIVALIGVVVMIAAMFLPYMTAQGKLAEYIELLDSMELEKENISANPSVVSVSKVIATIYGEDDGKIAKIIVLVLGGCIALTALFVLFKKPIAIMIFDLLTFGSFSFLNFAMREDFIDPDKYAWSIGYSIIQIAIAVVFVAAIWMLVKKIIAKRELKAMTIADPVAPVAETTTEQAQ